MDERTIERIKKLLALADTEKNDSQAQIEAALGKVSELLEAHNLTMEEVEMYKGHKPITKKWGGRGNHLTDSFRCDIILMNTNRTGSYARKRKEE